VRRTGRELALLVLASAAVPGLGHIFLGRRARGAAFLLLVLTTALVGLSLEPKNLSSTTCEYGRTYLLVAAIMQALLVLDVFERASGRRA
jgi:hypothetical protein